MSFFTVAKYGTAEVVEKKSRFIGEVFSVETEEAAMACVEQVRKKHYDARHHCFAFIVGEHGRLTRAADDGEPQGTAGKPILDVIAGRKLRNTLVVVTRYFGGTLLGTGGLVRAYQAAAIDALAAADLIENEQGYSACLEVDYTLSGKLQYIFSKRRIVVLDTTYTEAVCYRLLIPSDEWDGLLREVTELTAGKAELTERKAVDYAFYQGEYQIK